MESSEKESTSSTSRVPNTACAGSGWPPEAAREEVSLREWLDRPGRAVDEVGCLHVFRQVAEAVGLAHAQGVALTTVSPSCFVLSSFNRVTFIESASCSSSGSGSCDFCRAELSPEGASEEASCLPSSSEFAARPPSVEEAEEGKEDGDGGGGEVREVVEEKKVFPMKQILTLEFNWYSSPEEAAGGAGTFASDIYRLGVLLFELFCTFDSSEEKLRAMFNLRHRVLPPQLLLKWPKQASFCLWLLHPQPSNRPKISEILQSEFLNEPREHLQEHEAAIKLKEEIEDQELLREFLLQLQQTKQAAADKLHDTVCFLSADIEEVMNKRSVLRKNGESFLNLDKNRHSEEDEDRSLLHSLVNEDPNFSGSRKRFKPEFQNYSDEEDNENLAGDPRSELHSRAQENLLSKGSRLIKNFKKLEAAYFSTRYRLMNPVGKPISRKYSVTGTGRGSIIGTEGSSVDDLASKEGYSEGTKGEWISTFLEGLCKYLSYSKLNILADLKQGDLLNTSTLVCSLGFDRDKDFFATAGVNRKIKIFEYDMILNKDLDIHYPIVELASKSKVSSVCWNCYIKSHIASSDFEGVVQVWDVTRNQALVEMKEHERRVWSVDFSLRDPTRLASGSDDGTVKLWNINQAGSIGTIRTKANVCSVQFLPDSALSLAIGSADHNIYIYDIRNYRVPLCTLIGHKKTVSYVKFVDSSTLVSASTDNSLKLWDISPTTSRVLDNPLQTFTGHTNVKNFVGLSVSDGYIATGSETNEVFVYHKAFPMPVLSYKFNSSDLVSTQEVDETTRFISCVCWRGQSSTLLAANSTGNIKLLEMV